MSRHERGAILGIVLLSSLVFSVASLAVLTMASSRAQATHRDATKLRARYAAEAGLVWAMERLWVNPAYCGVPDPPPINGLTVDVNVTNCGTGNNQAVTATVTY